jgi:AcrR family transcriptional regulator
MPTSPEAARMIRRDALRNRDALVASAQSAFAARGLDASLEGVARDAGVSIGTLYRHFPTRLDLVQAVFTRRLEELLEAAERAAALPDAWAGFARYLEVRCEVQAGDRGLDELAGIRLPHSPCIDTLQARILDVGGAILRRVQNDGVVRADVTPEDLAFVVWSQARIMQATRDAAPQAWRRNLHLILDAFRADGATPMTEPPLTCDQLYDAMVHLGGAGPCALAATERDRRAARPADVPRCAEG